MGAPRPGRNPELRPYLASRAAETCPRHGAPVARRFRVFPAKARVRRGWLREPQIGLVLQSRSHCSRTSTMRQVIAPSTASSVVSRAPRFHLAAKPRVGPILRTNTARCPIRRDIWEDLGVARLKRRQTRTALPFDRRRQGVAPCSGIRGGGESQGNAASRGTSLHAIRRSCPLDEWSRPWA